jgi:hypothetical protein
MNQEKRIEKIQSSLTPKQVAILWLDEVTTFPNLNSYVNYVASLSPGNFPMERLPQQVEQSVRLSMKGRPEKEIWPVVRMAVRDVVCLIHIVLNINYKLMSRQREYYFLRMALSHWLHNLVLKDISDLRYREKILWQNWVDDIEDSLKELYSLQNMIESISTSYFEGRPILFSEVSEYLSDVIKRLEQQTDLFNKVFAEKKRCKRIDLEALRNRVKQENPQLDDVVEQSKSEALIFIGERDAALDLIEKLFVN